MAIPRCVFVREQFFSFSIDDVNLPAVDEAIACAAIAHYDRDATSGSAKLVVRVHEARLSNVRHAASCFLRPRQVRLLPDK